MLERRDKIDIERNIWKCPGECDGCRYKGTVPGTDERIDREPSYYCRLEYRSKAGKEGS